MNMGCRYGSHRVIEPKGLLPQAADRIDNNMNKIWDNEILINVTALNIDSASFTQMKEESGDDEEKLADIIMDIVSKRGKQHNPVTGSGGMLIGTVEKIGSALKGKVEVEEGDQIATLISLTLTPLKINEIKKVHLDKDRVDIDGKAILFERSIYTKLPEDMSETLALAVLDVAGAPAQTARLVKAGDTVVIMGAGGKSGILCAFEAKKRTGITGKVIGVEVNPNNVERLRKFDFCDEVIENVNTPLGVEKAVSKITNGEMADITINLVNFPNTEMASILATKDNGIVYFFSMATSFTKAALGAEGVRSDATMIIGNGYTKGHAAIAIQELRENDELKKMYEKLYAS
jgi:L-erythro-3,5-diaminohexanoate dehydrogenase